MKFSTLAFNMAALGALLVAGSQQLHAQAVYRIVGPDGRVTFSDKAPVDASKATATTANGKPVPTSDAGLPYELRQVATRYPVTMYSAPSCAPCNAGRILLQSRGIPFAENTVTTAEDAEALKRISGDNSLPFLTIGGQKIKGFSESEWTQFLTAANYPGTSLLPVNYRNVPAKPLVAVQKPATPVSPGEAQASNQDRPAEGEQAPPPQPSNNSSANPTGIKF